MVTKSRICYRSLNDFIVIIKSILSRQMDSGLSYISLHRIKILTYFNRGRGALGTLISIAGEFFAAFPLYILFSFCNFQRPRKPAWRIILHRFRNIDRQSIFNHLPFQFAPHTKHCYFCIFFSFNS